MTILQIEDITTLLC